MAKAGFDDGDSAELGQVAIDNGFPKSSEQPKSLQGQDLRLAAVLAALYGSFMFCRMFFSVCSEGLRRDPEMHVGTGDITFLVVISAVGFGIGKVASGVIIDKIDTKMGLYVSAMLTSALVLAFASCTSYSQMLVVSVLNSFPQAAGYPAVAKLAYEYIDPQFYGKAFSVISMGSRLGSLTSSLLIGAAIGQFGWRGATRLAPLVTLTVFFISLVLLRRIRPVHLSANGANTKPGQQPCDTPEECSANVSTFSKFQRVVTNKQWWVVNLASSFLLVSKGFEAYAAVYLGQLLKLSASASGMIISAIPGGIVLSLIVGGSYLETLPLRRKAAWTIALCVVNFVSLAMLATLTFAIELSGTNNAAADSIFALLVADGTGATSHTTTTLVSGLLFLMGFGAGYPFYIPQSIFALELGGKDSAMVVGCGELMQALVAASFALVGGKMAESIGWRYVMATLAAGGAASVICMCLFFTSRLQHDHEK